MAKQVVSVLAVKSATSSNLLSPHGCLCRSICLHPFPPSPRKPSPLIGSLCAGLMAHLSPKAVGQLSTVLNLLSWSVGTLLLAGRWALDWRFPFVYPFPALPLAARERVLQSWATGASLDLRALFKAFKGLAMLAFYGKVSHALSPTEDQRTGHENDMVLCAELYSTRVHLGATNGSQI
jgi:hypothetical protein